MWEFALVCYGVVAVIIALTVFILGIVTKDTDNRMLGGNIKFGVVNSVLIGAFWPLFTIAIACGYIYDAIAFLKKL